MPLLSVFCAGFLRSEFAIGVGGRGERRRGLPAAEDGEGKKDFGERNASGEGGRAMRVEKRRD